MQMPGGYPGTAIGVVSLALIVLAALAFFKAANGRREIDEALAGPHGKKRLGMFTLSRSDAVKLQQDRSLIIPERLWTYDNYYLDRFAAELEAANKLQLYFGPTMSWDIVFAISLSLAVVLFEFDLATFIFIPIDWRSELALFCASMGLVYGAADVAEDIKLTSILKERQAAIRTPHGSSSKEGRHRKTLVDGGEAAAANALTRIKFVSITLSLGGLAAFGIFSLIDRLRSGPPATPNQSSTLSPPPGPKTSVG
jgi:hypothetical protein